MNGQEVDFLKGQFGQFREDIRSIIQNEVRKLIEEQRKTCDSKFQCIQQKIDKRTKTNRALSFLGGIVGGMVAYVTSFFVGK